MTKGSDRRLYCARLAAADRDLLPIRLPACRQTQTVVLVDSTVHVLVPLALGFTPSFARTHARSLARPFGLSSPIRYLHPSLPFTQLLSGCCRFFRLLRSAPTVSLSLSRSAAARSPTATTTTTTTATGNDCAEPKSLSPDSDCPLLRTGPEPDRHRSCRPCVAFLLEIIVSAS